MPDPRRWTRPNDLRLKIIAAFTVGIALAGLNLHHAGRIVPPDVDVSFLAPDLFTIRTSWNVVHAYQGLTNSSYAQFCGDCRYSPKLTRRTTCTERAEYLMKTYKQSEQAAVDAVLDAQPDNCKMIRYNVTDNFLNDIQNGEVMEDVSMFHQKISKGTIGAPSFANSSISIYIYDTIPHKIGPYVEETMTRRYAMNNVSKINFMADVAIIELFRTYPGRTYDPHSAQLFIVPYPHGSHCLLEAYTTQWMNECKHVSTGTIQKQVLGNLPYYKGNESRHLFINSMETPLVHLSLLNVPLSLNLGPRLHSETAKHIVIPYLNDKESFQPSSIKRFDLEWWTRPRKFSLAYFFGSANKRMRNSERAQRLYFLEEDSIPIGSFAEKIYKNSVFCPSLPGDAPSQKRFFDVIMMGCIPVVLSFETEMQSASNKSWHSKNGSPIEDSFPWIKGSGVVDAANEIDYESFVVEVTGGVKNIKPVLEALFENPNEIRRRQIYLMKYASSFSYGMGENAHRYQDAFYKILQSLKFHLKTIK
eukprot:CCRYP_005185-RA/>CCRYP_005185-RA protein AED:0.07 eAED:0.07 QI:118/1/1/1/0.66/0.5/4/41/530